MRRWPSRTLAICATTSLSGTHCSWRWAALERETATVTREMAVTNGTDIKQLITQVSEMARATTADHAARVANEREIETQFDADSQLRNVQWATMMRRQADFQNTLADMGAKWPHAAGGPFELPNISNRNREHDGGSQ